MRRASLTLETNIEGADENLYLNEKDKPLNLANLKLQNDSAAVTAKATLAALSAKGLIVDSLRVPVSPSGKLFGTVGPESRDSSELTPRW